MYTYLIVLKEDVFLNKEVLFYFAKMNFTIIAYYNKLNILKIECDILLEGKDLQYIKSIEEDRTTNFL